MAFRKPLIQKDFIPVAMQIQHSTTHFVVVHDWVPRPCASNKTIIISAGYGLAADNSKTMLWFGADKKQAKLPAGAQKERRLPE